MEYLLISSITCSQLSQVIQRLEKTISLTPYQKIEVARVLFQEVPQCRFNFIQPNVKKFTHKI